MQVISPRHVPSEAVRTMKYRCPGQDNRWLRVELYRCPNCGAEEEIFSNETRVRCHECGEWIYKEQLPSCINWCASARQCLGEERWKRLTGEIE
ncbi:MAG: phosphohydrolase [Chloroflexota bacterium]|nr:phosphohydrolase [Chloroflexota bacterium]